MKSGLHFLSTIVLIFISLAANATFQIRAPQLDLDMTSRELSQVLKNQGYTHLMNGPLDKVVEMGKRNLQWLDSMNQSRDGIHKLHMTKRGELVGIPIESPREYNRETILADYAQALSEMPIELKSVIIDGKPFTQNPPIEDVEYLKWANKIDRVYQLGIRFMLMEPYLSELISRQEKDVRGIFYLSKDADLKNTLSQFKKFSEEKKTQYRDLLITVCYNNVGLSGGCAVEIKNSEKLDRLFNFFEKHKAGAQNTWNEYFSMPAIRSDITWTKSQSGIMSVPFVTPTDSRIYSFLKDNIEEEWQTTDWKLILDFKNNASTDTTAHVVFEPGVTPNVNDYAGNIITMDENSPIDEWDVQWTIRHEFGHVLGFADCYLEYYDQNKKVIVGYQLDITNLMCSRRGVFQPLHFKQLQQAYLK